MEEKEVEKEVEKKEEKVEEKIEEKSEPKKKKRMNRLVYWLIVIIGLVFIFFMSYRIGQRLADDKNSSKSSNSNSVTESNSNSNVESNANEESNSNSNEESNTNEESNSNSNEQTTNDNQQTTPTAYTVKDFVGTYESKDASMKVQFSPKATYQQEPYGIPGCGVSTFGNFVVEGDKLYLYPLVNLDCDMSKSEQVEANYVEVTVVSATELKIGNNTYTKANDTALNDTKDESGLRYAIKSLIEMKNNN